MSNFETQPLEDWFRDTPNGDVVLCDPFNGEPLCGPHVALDAVTPTEAFLDDFRLGNGYGHLRGFKLPGNADKAPLVGIYFTDPSHPAGLGDYAEFKDMAGNFDVVAYSNVQSVRLEEMRRRTGGMGKIALNNGVEVDATYASALLDSHPKTVDLSQLVDPITGEPMNNVARGIQAVRDAVVGQGLDQKDPNDPDLTYLATDYVFANTVQWHNVMSTGSLAERMGRGLTSLLVVLPYEMGDYLRKMQLSGQPESTTDFMYARPEYHWQNNEDASSYAVAHQFGHIPREALKGAAAKR
jgi:hypothetical protein